MTFASGTEKKYFTTDEANRMLPLVRAIVGDIVELFADVHERKERLMRLRQSRPRSSDGDPYDEELREASQSLDRDIERLRKFADELTELGVELKDPVVGLIDFPAMIEDREVYLCWKLGEDEVNHWHEVDAGFAGRQEIFEGSMLSSADDSIDSSLDS